MTSGILFALGAVTMAVTFHARRRWNSPEPIPIDDWSKHWQAWAIVAAALLASAISTCAARTP